MPRPKTTLDASTLNLPNKPGVYLMKDTREKILYIGKAKNLKKRVLSYFQKTDQHTEKTHTLLRKVATVDTILAPSELDAFILENSLIKEHQPPYNIKLRDDKQYPYLKLTKDPFPRLTFVRKISNDGARYFGPFSSASTVRRALRLIRSSFKIRTCTGKDPGRTGNSPCLEYHMHRCLAPCVFDVEAAYQKSIREVSLLLEGKNTLLQKMLEADMHRLSAEKRYEEAALIRDKLETLSLIQHRQKVIFHDHVDRDAIGLAQEDGQTCVVVLSVREGVLNNVRHFILDQETSDNEALIETVVGQVYHKATYIPSEIHLPEGVTHKDILEGWLRQVAGRSITVSIPKRGQKSKLVDMACDNAREQLLKKVFRKDQKTERVQQLQDALMLSELPRRIEAFDISNIQGNYMVASKVSFWDGQPDKTQYRKYNIKTVENGPNDTAAMYEVLQRRLRRIVQGHESAPDLIVIDGGMGQLNGGGKARREAGLSEIPMIGLAKREEEIFLPHNPVSLKLPLNSPALLLLRHIRDEAHRFAITFHRRKRGNAMLE